MTKEIKEKIKAKQDPWKKHTDHKRQKGDCFVPGDKVWIDLHPISKASAQKTSNFMPKWDGQCIILTLKSHTIFIIFSIENPSQSLGICHTSALK